MMEVTGFLWETCLSPVLPPSLPSKVLPNVHSEPTGHSMCLLHLSYLLTLLRRVGPCSNYKSFLLIRFTFLLDESSAPLSLPYWLQTIAILAAFQQPHKFLNILPELERGVV